MKKYQLLDICKPINISCSNHIPSDFNYRSINHVPHLHNNGNIIVIDSSWHIFFSARAKEKLLVLNSREHLKSDILG